MSEPEASRVDRLADLVRALQAPSSDAGSKEELVRRHEATTPVGAGIGATETGIAGKRLAEFVLVREIGRGGMGIIYEAIDPALDRAVALKVLPADFTIRPAMVERFRREATAVARLRHEGIIAIHRIEEAEGSPFFTMDLVRGASLDKVLAHLRIAGRTVQAFHAALGSEPPRTEGRYIELVVACIAKVCDALAHAHENGIVHRDVKPSNILIRDDGVPVLTDFGLARIDDAVDLTRSGEHPGTPSYMSPEQADPSARGTDARSDLFSIGTTLYEFLTLGKPFEGATSRQVLDRILRAEPRDPRALQQDIPEDLAAIVGKALEKGVEQRYQTARAMAADLRAFLAHMPVSARQAGLGKRLLRFARREPLRATLALTLAIGIPALAWLGGTLIAKNDAIAVGEREIDYQRRETLIAKALMTQNVELRATNPLMKLLDPGSMADELDRELQKSPTDVELLAAKGWVMMRTSGTASALRWLDGLGAVPSSRELQRLRVALLRTHGARLRRDAEEADALETRLGEHLTPFEGFLHFLGTLGKVPITTERLEESLDLAIRVHLEATRPRRVYAYYIAMFGVASGQAAKVLPFAEAATKHWSDDPVPWLLAAWTHKALKTGKARHFLEKSCATDPRAVSPLIELAIDHFDQGEFDDALPLLRKSVALEPSNEDCRSRLCSFALRRRDVDALRSELEAWENAAGTDWRSWNALAMFRIRQQLPQSLADPEAIERAFAKARELSKDTNFEVLWNYGSWKERRGDLAAALPALERALLNPNIYGAQAEQRAARERFLESVRQRAAATTSRASSASSRPR